jgi:hypothetical protein
MGDNERAEKQAYLRKEIMMATGNLITGQEVFAKVESKDFKAKPTEISITIEFKNMTSKPLSYYWLDQDRKRRGEVRLASLKFGRMDTFVGNPWVIEGPPGILAAYEPTMDVKSDEKITITTDDEYKTSASKDPGEFVNFMASQRQDGDDIDVWTMDELKEVINQYKSAGAPNILQELGKHYIPKENIANLYRQVQMPNALKPTALLMANNLSVIIGGSRNVKGGMLKREYTVYKISSQPFGWEVERRYSDFEWLRGYLYDDFPFTVIPPIPDKDVADKTDPNVVELRRNWLQKFLDSCIDHPELRSSAHLQGFLRLKDDKSWEIFKNGIKSAGFKQRNFKRNYASYGMGVFNGEGGIKLSDFSALSSTGNSIINGDYTDFVTKLTTYITIATPHHAKLKELGHYLLEVMAKFRDVTDAMAKTFKNLQSATEKFNDASPFGQCRDVESVYSLSANVFMNWSNVTEERRNVIKNTVVNV